MKINLSYDRPPQIETDLMVIILDKDTALFDLAGSPLQETVRRVAGDFDQKKIKKEYFATLDSKSAIKNVIIYSTSLSPAFNIWENLKTFIARAIRTAQDLSLSRVTVLLNTDAAVPLIGKAVEGAILGSYTFDKYRRDKSDLSKLQLNIVGLKAHDVQNRHYLNRYTIVSEAINEARDMINEPGSVVTPEYMAEAARAIAKEADLDVKVWDEKKTRERGLQRSDSSRPRQRTSSASDSAVVPREESKVPPCPGR